MKKTLLISLLITCTSMYAMLNPLIIENKQKIEKATYKIALHVFPTLNTNSILRFRYQVTHNNLEILQLICKNGKVKTIMANQIPNNLKNEFNSAHDEYEKHLSQISHD